MNFLNRDILPQIEKALNRGKSILLLGARQTGKTTLVTTSLKPDISISFAQLETKYRYTKNIVQFEKDLTYSINQLDKKPLVFIDEVQKIPRVMDSIQHLIDSQKAQFILSGSSARKLKHGPYINLLPGRIVTILMDPLTYPELSTAHQNLEELLTYGSLPGMLTESTQNKETDLTNYVMTYLEEEIRQEALVRNIGAFSQFLELSAIESGNIIKYTKIAQDIGISDHTIKEYFQILEDCLIAFKIEALTQTKSRRVLHKSPKYLFFDLGVRRIAAKEGPQASLRSKANWFEQYVGLELLRLIHIDNPLFKLHYWRDHKGVEIDFVINTQTQYIPVEVKWSDSPGEKDARHLTKFINEYDNCNQGYIVCQTPTPYLINPNITALPWQQLHKINSASK